MGKVTKKRNDKKKSKPNHQPIKKDVVKSRKDIRKEKRNLKKVHRLEYHNKNKNENFGKFVKLPQNQNDEDDLSNSDSDKKPKLKQKKVSPRNNDKVAQEIMQDKKREEKLKQSMKEHRNNQLLKANEEEDKIIKKLEKQLKLKKMKPGNISKSFASDGLNYLLEVCEESTMEAAITAEKHMVDNDMESDFEEDLAIAIGQEKAAKKVDSKKDKQNVKHGNKFAEMSDGSDNDDSSNDDDIFDDDGDYSENDDDCSENGEDSDGSSINQNKMDCQSQKYIQNKGTKNKSDSYESEEEEMEYNGEISEEELKMIYTGMSDFPDGIFRPGELTPIFEETESDLDPSKMQMESSFNISQLQNKCSFKSGLYEKDENSSIEDMSESSIEYEYDESDSEDSDACDSMPDEECENKQIIVNGKIINTYGREVVSNVEEDFERCPELDKLLESISDSEPSNKNKDSKDAVNNYQNSLNKPSDKSKKSATEDKINQENDNAKRKRKKSGIAEINNEDVDQISKSKKLRKMDDSISKKAKNNQNLNVSGKKSDNDSHSSYSDPDSFDSDFDGSDNDEDNASDNSGDDAFDNSGDDASDKSCDDGSDNDKDPHDGKRFNDGWEDIYGRKRDKDGNVLTENSNKYIPPHLRMKDNDGDSPEIIQLKRQIKGYLNKVTGTTMHWTSAQLETLYNSHSRNSVNNAFCSLWMAAVVQPVTTSDRLAIEHAMLVAVLHANIGSEIGAHFLQTIANKFNLLITDEKSESKELENLILGISHLYNFKIFHSSLLYEILNKFVENLSEKHIDCILVALRSVGGVLRKDDPTSLKAFIHNTQEKAGKIKSAVSGSRINFLLDVLLAIKNNNLNKIPNYDPTYSDELKKSIRGIIRKGNTVVSLNIKLNDLLNADQKGRWWIVGSAWEGVESNKKGGTKDESDKNNHAQNSYLLKLADTQRINTDLRRNIFCIVMSAEDYTDAFEKLQRLGLKNQQEREIIHVLISCCLQEKQYNPYYSILAQKFCDYDRKFQMSIQYSVWDKLKDIESCAMFQITNLGQFLTHLFVEKGLPLSVLKVIQFSDLTKASLRLMRQILLGILLYKNSQVCQEVFQRVSVSPKLHLFRESLRLFISHFLLKNTDKKMNMLTEEQMSTLKERTSVVDRILQSDSKFKL